jgi:hypothetical protein
LFKGSKHCFFTSSGGDLNKLNIDIEANDETYVQHSEDSVCKYSSEYLEKFVPAAKCADRVVIEFGKDYPSSYTYTQRDKFSLRFVLAPKVDND